MSELDARITRTLSESLAKHGFRFDRSEEWFIREIPGGFQIISVGIADYEPAFDFSPTFGVRLHQAEAIFNRVVRVESRYQPSTLTLVAQSDMVLGKDEWEGATDSGLEVAVDDMTRSVARRGVAFLERHRDLASLDTALNTEPFVDRSPPPAREMHGLVVAYLVGRVDVDALAGSYLAALPPGHVGRRQIEELAEYLRTTR